MKLLLPEDDVEVDLANNNGWTLLSFSAALGSMDLVELLLAHNVQVDLKDKDGWRPLSFAAQLGSKDVGCCSHVMMSK